MATSIASINHPTLPTDSGLQKIPLVPASTAIAVTVSSVLSSANNIVLNNRTQLVEVNALNQGVYMRYASVASSANFDEFIEANTVRHYVVPPTVTTVSFIEETAGAKIIIIEK